MYLHNLGCIHSCRTTELLSGIEIGASNNKHMINKVIIVINLKKIYLFEILRNLYMDFLKINTLVINLESANG